MAAPTPEYSLHIYAMMARLGIEPGAGVLPRLSLRYATAFRRCQFCPSTWVCCEWLEEAPRQARLPPRFCPNSDILFELQFDQPGHGRGV